MERTGFMGVHRTWEDWASICLGVVTVLTPWLAGATQNQTITLNAVIIGMAVVVLAAFALVNLHRGEEVAAFACGLWLMASPFVFGYAGSQLATWHYALGALIAVLALLEFWQDWTLSDDELAKHGR
ncbi:MAG: SPW repeat protein [Hyphomonadaceae bacterium]|nr:SPW repeat protein [Hyphomonadaceae bacterium]